MNVNFKYLIVTTITFAICQLLVWFQLNGQFFNDWFKKNPMLLSVLGIPVSYIYILATNYGYKAFDGLLWPQRFIGFSVGIVIFAFLTNNIMNEPMTTKTYLSLSLSLLIIVIQIFWK